MVETVSVPCYVSCVSCGNGVPFFDGVEYKDVPVDHVKGLVFPLIVKISGRSMEPFYYDSDYVIVDAEAEPRNGDIVLIFLNGEFFIKRLEFKNGKITLASANYLFPKIVLCDFDEWRIVGVCRKKLEGEKSNAKVFSTQ